MLLISYLCFPNIKTTYDFRYRKRSSKRRIPSTLLCYIPHITGSVCGTGRFWILTDCVKGKVSFNSFPLFLYLFLVIYFFICVYMICVESHRQNEREWWVGPASHLWFSSVTDKIQKVFPTASICFLSSN